jgi:2,3-bisphosphoglycerate-independent phosphoglycerate mutase
LTSGDASRDNAPVSTGLAAALRERYARGETDTWMRPLVAAGAESLVRAGDLVIFCCLRGDREAQLTEAFTALAFPHFPRVSLPGLEFVPLLEYGPDITVEPLIAPLRPRGTLGDALARAGLRQLAVSGAEKRTLVTFFFNGRRREPLPRHEARVVAGTAAAGSAAAAGLAGHDFVLVNFAAGDAVGHLPDFEAKVATVRAVDEALGEILGAAEAAGAAVLVTADHGLIEVGMNADGSPATAHTTSPVPLLASASRVRPADFRALQGTLADVAPTVLRFFGLPAQAGMTGASLIVPRDPCAKVALVILDGWGLGPDDPRTNPIAAAAPVHLASLEARLPLVRLAASGEAVGLPAGRSGNSEAGHLTIGAGRVVEQDEVRLARALGDGFASHPRLARLAAAAARRGASVHLIGMLSETSSHGTIGETAAIASAVRAAGAARVRLHLILDGHGERAADLLERHAAALGGFELASAVGRGYALDRSGDYGRTAVAYRALTAGEGTRFAGGRAG